MIAGDINNRAPMLIVGFSEYLDFFPNYIIANLNIQGIHAEAISLNLKSLNKRKFVSSTVLAQLFDTQEFRQEVIDAVRPHLGRAGRVGFPAVLGFHRSAEAIEHLSTGLTVPVFEIPGLPPSIPGMRLHNMLVSMIEKYHGSVYNGMQVSSYTTEERQIRSVISIASARNFSHPADKFILATGGILGGGITITQDGYAKEAIFEIPVILPEPGSERFEDQFLSTSGHPIFSRNILVDPTFQPCDKSGKVYYDNLYAIGSGIGRCDPIRERSMEGIALSTGLTISELLYAQ
jgi:glycerol-3-phosphate dehydrogenase subunit B